MLLFKGTSVYIIPVIGCWIFLGGWVVFSIRDLLRWYKERKEWRDKLYQPLE
jgi:hypothetical protein